MFGSYVIHPSLEERIQESGLLEKYPELKEKDLSGNYDISDVLQYLVYGPYELTQVVNHFALSMVGQEQLFWRTQESGLQERDLFGNRNKFKKQKAELGDIALATGYLLPNPEDNDYYNEPKEFDKNELLKWEEYGFSSALEMIMSLSAYRSREVLQHKPQQYEWVNNRGIRNVITACTHGDPKFYQYDETNPEKVISPFGNEVGFSPRRLIGSMTQVYHSHEPSFFATFFRYAYECGELQKIMGKNGEKFLKGADNLPGILGAYGDAGCSSHTESSEMLFRSCIPIGGDTKNRNVHIESFGPNHSDRKQAYYEFKIGENNKLELHNVLSGEIDMVFYPEDCEDLLKGILHQCAYGHGRTSKKQIFNMIEYVYSQEAKEEIERLGGMEIPSL